MANLHMVNVSALDFHVWQHLKDNRNETQLQHVTTIPSITVNNIYQHIINGTQHIMPFDTTDESTEDTDLMWTLAGNTEMHITSAERLRLAPRTTTKGSLIDKWMIDNSCLMTNPYHSILPLMINTQMASSDLQMDEKIFIAVNPS